MSVRPVVAGLFVGLVVSAFAGCSDGEGGLVVSAPDFGGVNVPDVLPAGQQAAFADGVITLTEYHHAVRVFVACGHGDVFLQSTDPDSVFLLYGTKGDIGVPGRETDTVAGRCYRDTVSWIELVFSATSDAAQEEGERDTIKLIQNEARLCLEKHGVDIPEPLVFSDAVELMGTLRELERSGRCTEDSLWYDGEPGAP